MSEFGPGPEQDAEKETQGVTIAQEIADLQSRAKTDADYEAILQKTRALKELFGITSESESTGEAVESIEKAKEILGEDVFGPEEVEKAFGIKINPAELPSIPFSIPELEKAKSLGQFLTLRVNHNLDGSPLTMERMADILKAKGGKALRTDWHESEKFYTEETPQTEWALTSKEVIPNSPDQNYLDQTQTIVDYLNQAFPDGALPAEYQEAISEFTSQKAEIESLMDDNWQEADKRLEALKITQLTRQTPVEALYDLLMYQQNRDERLLKNMYSWTSRRDSDGSLVCVGGFKSDGVDVDGGRPGGRGGILGVSFSRSQ